MMFRPRFLLTSRVAVYLMLWNASEVAARPNPQEPAPTPVETIVPVTSTVTVDGQPITATYTPTSFAVSGLAPPITAGTTVTTTDDTGATIAVAIAAGAGIVGGGALAAWLFEPVPGVPPAPTEPPAYTTEDQPDQPSETEQPEEPETTTASEAPACPFPTGGAGVSFGAAEEQPAWTIEIPSQTASRYAPQCTPSGENGQLFRASFPEFIEELSVVFCESDLSGDVSTELGKDDLPDDSSWKRDDGPEEKIQFSFDFKNDVEGCASHCESAFSRLISGCQFNSHYLYGGGSLEQNCGNYSLEVDAEPVLTLSCTGDGDDPLRNYMYRDAAMEAIENFCTAQDGNIVEQDNEGSFIEETAFSIKYSDQCGGSGSYTVDKDLCVKYLSQTVDDCDTDTVVYKHGGSLKDDDNCGLFEFHPKGYDLVACFPENRDAGYITQGEHATITKTMAEDAINEFCERSGDGQQYTLDPAHPPDTGDFISDTCKEEGMASCGYYYRNDGTRVTEGGDIGDIVLRLEAMHLNPNDALECSAPQKYEIHGDRCKNMLAKFIGEGGVSKCADDEDRLDLGSIIENGDKGCVVWNAWAVKTR